MTTYEPRNLIRIDKVTAEFVLMWNRFAYWIGPASREPDPLEPWLVPVDPAEDLPKAAEMLDELADRTGMAPFKDVTRADHRWWIVVSSAFEASLSETKRLCFSRGFGRRVNFYYEHPAAVDETPIGMAIDVRQDADGFHDRPEGRLCVVHLSSFGAPGLGVKAWHAFSRLPHWTVKAPASLAARATDPPVRVDGLPVNRIGTGEGRRLVFQEAYRESDLVAVCDWLKIPMRVYFRVVPFRHVPADYLKRAQLDESRYAESSPDCPDRQPALGESAV